MAAFAPEKSALFYFYSTTEQRTRICPATYMLAYRTECKSPKELQSSRNSKLTILSNVHEADMTKVLRRLVHVEATAGETDISI